MHSIPDIYVMARILQVLDNIGPVKKTNAQMLSRVNYNVFTKYLKWMIEFGFIEIISNSEEEHLILTDKGRLVLTRISAILEEIKC